MFARYSFFFQAEDGIRDTSVTGVQTCALPIWNIPERLHTVESAADLLGSVSPPTIRSWLTEGKLTRVKFGRLTRVREFELLGLIKVKTNDRACQGSSITYAHKAIPCFEETQPVARKEERDMY